MEGGAGSGGRACDGGTGGGGLGGPSVGIAFQGTAPVRRDVETALGTAGLGGAAAVHAGADGMACHTLDLNVPDGRCTPEQAP